MSTQLHPYLHPSNISRIQMLNSYAIELKVHNGYAYLYIDKITMMKKVSWDSSTSYIMCGCARALSFCWLDYKDVFVCILWILQRTIAWESLLYIAERDLRSLKLMLWLVTLWSKWHCLSKCRHCPPSAQSCIFLYVATVAWEYSTVFLRIDSLSWKQRLVAYL